VAIPEAEELAVYVVEGNVAINGECVGAGVLAVLENSTSGSVTAESAARIMFAGGDTLEGKRYIWWNFVSSSRERIEQAKKDWRERRFDAVPGETDFIPLPER
jgi:redox-sensitive bicupin YhaK (pirin superfamily)